MIGFVVALSLANRTFAADSQNDLESVRNAYQVAFNEGKLGKVLKHYVPTADVVNADGSVLRGIDEIRHGLDALMKDGAQVEIVAESTRYLSSSIVIEDGHSTLTTDSNGAIQMRYTAILMHSHGKWSLVSLRSSLK